MKVTGGCYCGKIRYEFEGEPTMAAQCHCRECQYITGGHPNTFIGFTEPGFKITQGELTAFQRQDIDQAYIRNFCSHCGTSIGTQAEDMPGAMFVKVGTLDDPSIYKPQVALFTKDAQSFHHIPDGIPAFEGRPG